MNDWNFLVLFEILGYLEGALRQDSISGSRGGGSRLCKQDVDGKIDLKKLCDSRSLRLYRSSSPATNKARHVTCATEYDSYCPLLYCFNLVLFEFIKRVMPHRSCVFQHRPDHCQIKMQQLSVRDTSSL